MTTPPVARARGRWILRTITWAVLYLMACIPLSLGDVALSTDRANPLVRAVAAGAAVLSAVFIVGLALRCWNAPGPALKWSLAFCAAALAVSVVLAAVMFFLDPASWVIL